MIMPFDKDMASVYDVCGVTKRYGSFTALDNVSLSVRSGEITALAGPNGAGKTTLFHVMNGNLRPDAGRVMFGGADVTGMSPWKMARFGVGRLFQDVRVFPNLSVRENIEASCIAAGKERGNAMKWLDRSGLGALGRVRAGELSFTEKKLLALTRLLALEARVLLLDEPTAALPPDETERVCAFIRGLAVEHNVSVVLVEHNVSMIRRLADTVYFLHEGRILRSGTSVEVFGDPCVERLYADGKVSFRSDPGRMEFVETPHSVLDAAGWPKRDVAFLCAERNMFESLCVMDNLLLACWKSAAPAARARLKKSLELFPFIRSRLRQRAGTLSGGQRQALAIAMVMCRDKRKYFFDEPSAGLAPCTAAAMFAAIRRFAEENLRCRILVKESK